jgi:hypothetical protein
MFTSFPARLYHHGLFKGSGIEARTQFPMRSETCEPSLEIDNPVRLTVRSQLQDDVIESDQ